MTQTIYPYGAPRAIRDNLFQIAGSLKVPIPRNMTVLRTERGELVLYSVIAMHEDGMRALEALGRPAVMVIPHRRHQMDAEFYKSRYPDLRVLAPDRSQVHSVRVDGDLSELKNYDVQAYVLPGNTYQDVVLDLPVPDGRALTVCESLGNVKLEGPVKLLFRLVGPPGGGFGVARAVRLREIRGAAKLRDWLTQQSDRTDLRALLFGHGDPITDDVPAALRRAASQV